MFKFLWVLGGKSFYYVLFIYYAYNKILIILWLLYLSLHYIVHILTQFLQNYVYNIFMVSKCDMLSLEAHVYNNNLNIKSDALYLFLLPISNSTFKTFLLSKTFSENVTFSYAAIKTVIFFTKKVVGYFQTLMIDATFHVKSTFFFFFHFHASSHLFSQRFYWEWISYF